MSEHRGRLLASTLATALLLVAGCSGDDAPADGARSTPAAPGAATPSATSAPSATAAAEPSPLPTATEAPRPRAGSCHRLDFDEALAPTAGLDAAACGKRHTSETYAVGRVDALADGHLLAVDSARVQRQVATTCPAALPGAVGGTVSDVRLSMLRPVWFTPTVEESDAGADWYRCDVVVLAGADRLLPVTGSLVGVLDSPEGGDAYGMCGTAGPDDERFRRVPCGEPHAWRAFQVIDLPAGPYPGRGAIADAGSAPCQDAAAAIAADPLDYEWGFEGPDPDQWAAGQTFIRCWTPD